MALSQTQKQEIANVLFKYAEGYKKKDVRAILELCSQNITGFGSGIDEVYEGRQQVHEALTRDLKQADEIALKFSGMKCYGDPVVAWLSTGCTFEGVMGKERLMMNGRMTAVLKNTGSRWLIEQIHFSMPFAGQEPGQSYGRTR
ncbi:MAG: nuclear transport factor 2 family protein [Methanoregula sp.]|nr:nuclear transport factor 2 family protein [Methanoregula sp.]